MTLTDPLGSPSRDVTPGTLPTWAVVFSDEREGGPPRLTISGDVYDGSVTATLPADLSGGRYEIVVEGLTDEDYQRIRLPAGNRNHRLHGRSFLVVDVHLQPAWRQGEQLRRDLVDELGAHFGARARRPVPDEVDQLLHL